MKPFYLSKTLWFNALTILIAVATFYGYTPDQELMTKVSLLLVTLSPFANILLRLVTSRGVGL